MTASNGLTVGLSFKPKSVNVGVTIKKDSKFVLVGRLSQTEAVGFMFFVLSNDLTDDELKAYARCYDIKPPLR